MNIAYKQVSAFVFSVIITTSAFGMEHENITDVTTQPVTAWYKKGSVYTAGAIVTLAVVGYACAVRMGKVAIPALVAGLVAVKSVQELAPQSDFVNSDFVNNDVSTETVIVEQNQNQDQVVVETSKEVEQTNAFNDIVVTFLENLTLEDIQRINEELVR